MTVRHAEVVVIGAGIAGLAAAFALRDRDVLVLEAVARPGGRIESLEENGYWVNLGAHLLGAADGPVARLAGELGVPVGTPGGTAAAIMLCGRLVRPRGRLLLPLVLPMSLAARLSLMRAGLRLARAHRKARRADPTDMVGALPSPDYWPADPELDAISYADVLGVMHPEAGALMRVTANRLGTEPDRLSGHIGATVAMSRWNKRKPVVLGGMGRLVDALADRLGSRLILGAKAIRVNQDETGVRVELAGGSTVEASQCVVSVPAPEVQRIVTDPTPAKNAALAKVRYGPFVVAGIFTRETRPMPWDDVYGIAVPDRSFCMMFNPANAVRRARPRRPGGSLVLYAAGDRAADLLTLPDSTVIARFSHDLETLFPEARGIIDTVTIRRWPLGVPVPGPMRAALQPHLVASVGRIHFCGDYIAHPGTDSAVWTAEQAFHAVRRRLECR